MWLLIPSEENKCWCKAKPNIESNGDRQLRLRTVEILLSTVGTLATGYGFKAAQIYLNPRLSPHLQQQYRLGDCLVKQFWGMKPIKNQPGKKKVKRFILFYYALVYCQIKLAQACARRGLGTWGWRRRGHP